MHTITPRTVVEAFLPASGEASLADVYDTANLAGLGDQTVRLAIRRMIACGDLTQHGRGRSGTLTSTVTGRRRLEQDRRGLALAFAQDAGEAPWDGRWRLLAVSVPEDDRAVRDRLRRDCAALGAVAVSTGLYVSPHDLVSSLSVDVVGYLSSASSDDLDVRGVSDPSAIAETLWPSGPVVDTYREVDEAIRARAATPPLVRQLHLADAFERAMRHDPLLPLELRATPWEPSAIRTAWAREWEVLREVNDDALYRGWWPH